MGVLFPSSIPESEKVVLVEDSLSDFSDSDFSRISPILSPTSSGSFLWTFCCGRGTGTAMVEPGSSSVDVSGWFSFLGNGTGAGEEGVVGLGVSGGWSPSKLV